MLALSIPKFGDIITLNLFHCHPLTALLLCAPFQLFPLIAALLTFFRFIGLIRMPVLLFLYLLFETTFYAWYTIKAKQLQKRVLNLSRDKDSIVALFTRALSYGLPVEQEGKPIPHDLQVDSEQVEDFRRSFSAWFFGQSFTSLGRDDVLTWLAWSLFDGELEHNGEDRKLCEDCVDMVEKRGVWKFKQGKTNVKSIRLTIDPLRVGPRPFFLYVSVWFWNKFWELALRRKGFVRITSKDGSEIQGLLHVPVGWNEHKTRLPLLFLHGLGLGFAQYKSFIQVISEPSSQLHRDRPVLILLQPNISMTLGNRYHLKPPTKEVLQDGLLDIFKQLGWEEKGIEVLSHSFGTIVHGQLLKARPGLVKRSCFVDPVCFCLWEPYVDINLGGERINVLGSFLYKIPESGIEMLMRFFVARELGIALSVQRYFDWADNLLWHYEIPDVTDPTKTSFFLAGQDGVAYTPRVRRYLLERGVSEEQGGLWLEPEAAHGESLITGGKTLSKIMTWLSQD